MIMKKISQIASRLSLRNSRLSSVKKPNKKRPLEFFADELEKRQLLTTTVTNTSGTNWLIRISDTSDDVCSLRNSHIIAQII